MRADRLVSILMLLQTHGKMPAPALAQELEVSVRTIYRDIEALSAAGVPVYTERGAEGGCCLVEDYSTNLTGLTDDEAQALLLLSVPGPLDGLELGQKLKAALRKLYAALPLERGEQLPRSCLHLDWAWWGQAAALPGYLEQLYQAAQERRSVRISYLTWNGSELFLTVHPLGLVAKAGQWYLVYEMQQKYRAQRFSDMLSVERLEESFSYPPGFDLGEFWQQTCAAIEREFHMYATTLRLKPLALRALVRKLGEPQVQAITPEDAAGWATCRVNFEALEVARQHILALGGSVEVVEPLALRLSVQDYARQIGLVYAND